MVSTPTLLFGALLVVCAGVVVVFGRQLLAHRRSAAAAAPGEAPTHSALVAMHVLDAEGQALGEVVRVQGDEAVVKHGQGFLVLPRAALAEEGGKLRAGAFDRAEAEAKGEAWRKGQENVMRYDDKGMPISER